MQWASLSQAAKSVYPVIAVHTNQEGYSNISQQTIAIMSWVSEKTARKGINDLQKQLPFFSYDYVRKSKRKEFYIEPVALDQRNGKNKIFAIHKFLIESGYWSILKPCAKALYIAMKCLVDRFNLSNYNYCVDCSDRGASSHSPLLISPGSGLYPYLHAIRG